MSWDASSSGYISIEPPRTIQTSYRLRCINNRSLETTRETFNLCAEMDGALLRGATPAKVGQRLHPFKVRDNMEVSVMGRESLGKLSPFSATRSNFAS